MSEKTTYRPFDGSEETFHLRIDSNENIKQLGKVLTSCHQKEDQERIYYAQHCELAPERYDEDGSAIYTFKNIHSLRTLWPALAQALFYEFPTIVEVNDDGTAEIVDEQKHGKLIRSEVMRGRDDFLGKFGVHPYEAERLFNALSSDLPFPTMNRILNPTQALNNDAKDKSTETTS